MVICFYKQQAEILFNQTTFEIDMSYKRIRQKDMNEIVLAKWLPQHGKSGDTLQTRSESNANALQ